jgi:phosphatidylglycerophosphate synthase
VLTTRHKGFFSALLAPLAKALAQAGVSPTALTLATPVLTALVCWWFLRTRAIGPFCVVVGVVAAFDGLDGAVARAAGRVTKLGAYLDAVCDRYVDSLLVLTVAAATGYWALGMVVLAGALLISYTKARAAMEVPVGNQEWPDLMERTERLVLLLGGFAASEWLGWRVLGRDLCWWALVGLAVLSHATVLQRIIRAKRFIESR